MGWVERFVGCSWDLTEADVHALRAAGLRDRDVVDWAQVASLQTWLVMTADGGGVTLDSEQESGQAVGHDRRFYHSAPAGRLGAEPGAAPTVPSPAANGIAWVDVNPEDARYREVSSWAQERYGFIPNLLTAESLGSGHYDLHRHALELLERPQSPTLTTRRHAMVRALVSTLNRCAYSAATTRQYLSEVGEGASLDAITGDYTQHDWAPADRVVLDFAVKALRNAYKITASDAQGFRDVGLGDEAYVDVLNTVSVQTSLDRLANALGVIPDAQAILPSARTVGVSATG